MAEIGKNKLVKFGKKLSYLLRHDDTHQFDEHGYRTISDLVNNHGFTFDLIQKIVETNDKQRYEFSSDKTKIRARQGHSVDVNVDLKETTPPNILFHGTSITNLQSIKRTGIDKSNRLYVHLSDNEELAYKVGERHGVPYVIKINTKQMVEDGIIFYLSNNNVYLTKFVDKKYFLN